MVVGSARLISVFAFSAADNGIKDSNLGSCALYSIHDCNERKRGSRNLVLSIQIHLVSLVQMTQWILVRSYQSRSESWNDLCIPEQLDELDNNLHISEVVSRGGVGVDSTDAVRDIEEWSRFSASFSSVACICSESLDSLPSASLGVRLISNVRYPHYDLTFVGAEIRPFHKDFVHAVLLLKNNGVEICSPKPREQRIDQGGHVVIVSGSCAS